MGTMKGRGRGALTALAAAVLVVAVAVPLAVGAEPTREEYVAQVEPICKANSDANARILKGAKGEVNSGKLVKASKRFKRARTALAKTIGQLAAVPQPSADATKLTKWLGYLKAERDLLGKIGTALAAEERNRAQGFAVRLKRNSDLANNTVLEFGFDHCRIESSRFV
jgi:hypothetical protein